MHAHAMRERERVNEKEGKKRTTDQEKVRRETNRKQGQQDLSAKNQMKKRRHAK